MRSGWRPERRNRKLGTANSGWRKQNRMVVPNSRHDEFAFYERLGRHTVSNKILYNQEVTVLEEPARAGSTYGCSARDVLHVLKYLPREDVAGLKLLVMRQPTRKQETLRPVWGRCLFDAWFGKHKGPAIMLEATNLSRPIRWTGKISIEDHRELDRLADDGHQITRDRRGVTIKPTEQSARNTILYHTLLHEVGHWVDWKHRVLSALDDPRSPDRKQLATAYFARAHREGEHFADNYAERQAALLRDAGVIPFETLD